jgi:hypothetical protein
MNLHAVGMKLIRYKEAALVGLAGSTTIVVMTLAGGVAERTVGIPPTIPEETRASTSTTIPPTTTTIRGSTTTTTFTAGIPETSNTITSDNPSTITSPITTMVFPTTVTRPALQTTTTISVPPATHRCRTHNTHCRAPVIPPGQDKPKPIHPRIQSMAFWRYILNLVIDSVMRHAL